MLNLVNIAGSWLIILETIIIKPRKKQTSFTRGKYFLYNNILSL